MQPQVFRERESDSCLYNSGSSRHSSVWEGVGAEHGVSGFWGRGDPKEEAWAGVGELGAFPSAPELIQGGLAGESTPAG